MADGTAVAHAFVAAEITGSMTHPDLPAAIQKIERNLKPQRMVAYAAHQCPGNHPSCLVAVGGNKHTLLEVRQIATLYRPGEFQTAAQCGIRASPLNFVKAMSKALACFGLVVDAEKGIPGPMTSQAVHPQAAMAQTPRYPQPRPAWAPPKGSNASDTSTPPPPPPSPPPPSPPPPPPPPSPPPPRVQRFDYIVYLRTDLWFALPPPAIETFSNLHVTVPFCNPLPSTTKCGAHPNGPFPRPPRSRSTPGYFDGLGRGGLSGCDVPTDWMAVVPRSLAEIFFRSRDSLRVQAPPNLCEAHRSGCFCHDPRSLQPECLLGGYLGANRVQYTRRDFGLIALARQVIPSPSSHGGDGVYTDVAIMGNGINLLDCETSSMPPTGRGFRQGPKCPRFCARGVYSGRASFKGGPLTMACFPGEKPIDDLKLLPPGAKMVPAALKVSKEQTAAALQRGRERGRGRGVITPVIVPRAQLPGAAQPRGGGGRGGRGGRGGGGRLRQVASAQPALRTPASARKADASAQAWQRLRQMDEQTKKAVNVLRRDGKREKSKRRRVHLNSL